MVSLRRGVAAFVLSVCTKHREFAIMRTQKRDNHEVALTTKERTVEIAAGRNLQQTAEWGSDGTSEQIHAGDEASRHHYRYSNSGLSLSLASLTCRTAFPSDAHDQ